MIGPSYSLGNGAVDSPGPSVPHGRIDECWLALFDVRNGTDQKDKNKADLFDEGVASYLCSPGEEMGEDRNPRNIGHLWTLVRTRGVHATR